ncbi:MAG TPA: AAA family ATPase [Acidobacteriota bacterium]|nr:AAA family ATPase [Acidobacteriota bacterium]
MSRNVQHFASTVLESVGRRMFGLEEVTRLCLCALYSGGHVLLEGNPGLGKTDLIKNLGRLLALPFGRIQFTPDLMPADITGTLMPGADGQLAFRPGPVFTSLLLADEINRATPKTQSAMLEAMAEKQVTVLGEKRLLERPFMVLATQNPIDMEGTYNLPEAQADRFMFKILMPVPHGDVLRRIVGKRAGRNAAGEIIVPLGEPDEERPTALPQDLEDSRRKYQELRRLIHEILPLPAVEEHISNLFLASNSRLSETSGLDKSQVERLGRLGQLLLYGLGPRAGIDLMRGAKAYALLFRPGSEAAEGIDLVKVAAPALRHRVLLDLDWDERYRGMTHNPEGRESALRERLLGDFFYHAAPASSGYRDTLRSDPVLRGYIEDERWS